jgi:MFS family permease
MFAGLTRNTFLLALASFFSDISTEMLYPVLPVYLTGTLKADGAVVGLIEGVAGATQNIVPGFAGPLSDRLKRRKGIALVGFALSAVSKPLIGLSTAWTGVLGARFLDRFGAGTRGAPRDALVAASAAPEHRGKAFGLEGFGDNAGAFVGPLIAVALLAAWRVNLRWIFYAAIIPGFLAFLMVLLVRERKSEPSDKANFASALRRFPRRYRGYLIATAIFGLGNSSNAFLILDLKGLGVSLTATILVYAAFNLVAALVSYPAGALSDRLGRRAIIFMAFAVFFVAYAGFAVTRSAVVAASLFVLYGLFQGLYRMAGKAFAADLSPEDQSASGVGWFGASAGVSGLVASGVAGLLWDHAGHAAVFYFGAALAIAGVLAMAWLTPERAANAAVSPD